jgi:hypothetical protein
LNAITDHGLRELLGLTLEEMESEQASVARKVFAGYVLGERVGDGHTSVINHIVSSEGTRTGYVLRRMSRAEPTPEEVEDYRGRLELLARMPAHPNILHPDKTGADDEGQPYAVLRYVDRTMAQALAFEEWPPQRCVEVLLQIAKAVSHAHRHHVVHCDLKPKNVLWESTPDGERPLVIDFSSAQHLLEAQAASSARDAGLTYGYTSPEQARGAPGSAQSDIYSLGVMFYEMLTGRLPYEGPLAAVIGGLTSNSPVASPREHDRYLPGDVTAVCLLCLEKAPENRYPSADALVRDLERLARGERPRGPVGWLARSCRNAPQRPLQAALLISAIAAGVTIASSFPLLERQRFAVASNTAVAEQAAERLRREFAQYASQTADAARNERVVQLLGAPTPQDNAGELEPYRHQFSGMFVMDASGQMRAHHPHAPPFIFRSNFEFRDYLQGALRLAAAEGGGVYVSRAFRSETTDQLELGFAVPIRLGADQGIVLARRDVREVLLPLLDGTAESGDRRIVLLGRRDRSRVQHDNDQPLPATLGYLGHGRIVPGNWEPLAPEYGQLLEAAFRHPAIPGRQLDAPTEGPVSIPHYRDPFEEGSWSAVVAPVGRTGYFLLLQSKSMTAWEMSLSLGARFCAAFCAGLLLLGLATWYFQRRHPRWFEVES